MRVLVVSDSHGRVDRLLQAVAQTQPHYVLHLGDCQRDLEALRREFPTLPMEGVPGNCDWGSLDTPERLIELGGVRLFLLHGHTRNVKSSPMSAMYAAREWGAQVLLFGHTHRPLVDNDGTLLTLNPGAAGDPLRPTCGILTLENGRADAATVQLGEEKQAKLIR